MQPAGATEEDDAATGADYPSDELDDILEEIESSDAPEHDGSRSVWFNASLKVKLDTVLLKDLLSDAPIEGAETTVSTTATSKVQKTKKKGVSLVINDDDFTF